MSKPEIIIISALAESNRLIGKEGKLPWKIPEDAERFQRLTLNHTVVMGRKTWEYDVEKLPLKNRVNIVISSQKEIKTEEPKVDYPFGLIFVESLEEALEKSQDAEKVFIVGGASIYAQALEIADTLDLTLVEGEFEGDTFFPEYQYLIGSKFELVKKELRPGFRFDTYKRIAQL